MVTYEAWLALLVRHTIFVRYSAQADLLDGYYERRFIIRRTITRGVPGHGWREGPILQCALFELS